MRIHTSLTHAQMLEVVRGLPSVAAEVLTEHESATHPRAFEMRLSGSSLTGGQFGASDYRTATWDEWGIVMGRIFDADPTTRMGGSVKRPVYADAEDFHWQTGDRFTGGFSPADTHPRHVWDRSGDSVTGSYIVHECRRCSALRRMGTAPVAHIFA
jgi:hypothetical protein